MAFVNANPEGNLGQFPWPHFQGEGGAVASLANAIQQQRINQTQNFQKTLAQSIKEFGDEQDANQALKAAGQMEGLPSPGGLSGAGGLANYIKLVNAQKQAELADYYRSHGGLYDTQAAAGGYNPRTGAGRGGSGAYTVTITNPDGTTSVVPAGSKVGQDWIRLHNPSLQPALTSGQATGLAKNLGVNPAVVLDPSKQQGFQSVPGGVDQQGNEVPLPLSPDQTYQDATDIGLPSATAGSPQVKLPKAAFEQIKRGLTGPDRTGGQQGGGAGSGNVDALRAQAQDAINRGAPSDAVGQKFKQMTGQDL